MQEGEFKVDSNGDELKWANMVDTFRRGRAKAGNIRYGIFLRNSQCFPLPADAKKKIEVRSGNGCLVLGIRPDATEADIEEGIHTFLTIRHLPEISTLTPEAVRADIQSQLRDLESAKMEGRPLVRDTNTETIPIDVARISAIIREAGQMVLAKITKTPEKIPFHSVTLEVGSLESAGLVIAAFLKLHTNEEYIRSQLSFIMDNLKMSVDGEICRVSSRHVSWKILGSTDEKGKIVLLFLEEDPSATGGRDLTKDKKSMDFFERRKNLYKVSYR